MRLLPLFLFSPLLTPLLSQPSQSSQLLSNHIIAQPKKENHTISLSGSQLNSSLCSSFLPPLLYLFPLLFPLPFPLSHPILTSPLLSFFLIHTHLVKPISSHPISYIHTYITPTPKHILIFHPFPTNHQSSIIKHTPLSLSSSPSLFPSLSSSPSPSLSPGPWR